jgi:hypothetical protein
MSNHDPNHRVQLKSRPSVDGRAPPAEDEERAPGCASKLIILQPYLLRVLVKCLNHRDAAPKLTAEEQNNSVLASKWRERRDSNPRPST